MATSAADAEKKIRALRKKLGQIEKLREKDLGELDPAAREKVNSEPALNAEVAALEAQIASGDFAEVAAAPVQAAEPEPAAPPKKPAAATAKAAAEGSGKKGAAAKADAAATSGKKGAKKEFVVPGPPVVVHEDLHKEARAEALQHAPGDLGLLLGDEVEKRFKNLQKKLREIGKLHEKTEEMTILERNKAFQEEGFIKEAMEIRFKAQEVVASRRAALAAVPKKAPAAPKVVDPEAKKNRPDWMCNNCGEFGKVEDLIGSEGAAACHKCGSDDIKHFGVQLDSDEEEGDEVEPSNAKEGRKHESNDLKTGRQKKNADKAGKKSVEEGIPSPDRAKWPEVKEVLESGDRGVDKARQRRGIEVNRAKDKEPYDVFDITLLRCSFLTKVELKLPPGVLAAEEFSLYFPGALADGLLELVLKGNELTRAPPGLSQLQRIRSIDLSHNKIETLPGDDSWGSISSTLELLDLSFNKLTSIEELAPLKKLSQLKVDKNELTSLKGVSWADLKQIVSISAAENQIKEIPAEVEKAGSLEHLELSENKITTLPTGLVELKKLKTLNIAGNPIKDQKIIKAGEKGIKDLKAYLTKIGGAKGKK